MSQHETSPHETSSPGGIRLAGRRHSITVYSRPDCHLCADAMAILRGLQDELGFVLQECDIDGDQALQRAYFERIPVIALDGEELFDYFVDEKALRERLESRR
jgi:glutaredoxin